MSLSSSFREYLDFQDRTCEAILLGLQENLHAGYTFPRASEIEEAIVIAMCQICGKGEGTAVQGRPITKPLLDSTKISSLVRKGIYNIFLSSKDQTGWYLSNSMDEYLMHNSEKINWQWFFGFGDMFRFRPGKRQDAEESVRNYWSERDIRDFSRLNEIAQEILKSQYKGKSQSGLNTSHR